MCRGENEPNGPYRCSADMKNALLSTKAHYAEAVQNVQTIKTQLENVSAQAENFREMVDNAGMDASETWISNLEKLEQNKLALEAELVRTQTRASDWQAKLREAQKNYDSTRGGVQDLSEEYNAMMDKLKQMEEDDESKPEDIARLRAKIDHTKARIDAAIGVIKTERKKPLAEEAEREGATEGIDMNIIDNSKDSPSKPDGTEADVLIHPEMDAALDFMIDDLELSAVDKKYMGIVDPDTGEMFDEHEMQVVARRQQREARMRLKRQREADGDGREMMRSFLRNAVYRALRYNKATRKLIRLIGVKHYNDLLQKIDDIRFEAHDAKVKKANEKWKKQRVKVADREFNDLEKGIQKHRERYDNQMEKIVKLEKEGYLSQEQFDFYSAAYENELRKKTSKAEQEQTNIELLRSEWAMEEAEEVKIREARAENIRQAMIERKRQKEKMEELMAPLR